ncbi:GRAM domain-containing protein, partial [Striga asiatica]
MEWIGSVSNNLDLMNMDQRSEGKSNLDQSILVDSVNGGVDTILGPKISDPNHVKRKGAPRKLRQKGALEKISKKLKVSSKQKNMASSKPHESATYVQPMVQANLPTLAPMSYSQELFIPSFVPNWGTNVLATYEGDKTSKSSMYLKLMSSPNDVLVD